MSRPVVVVDRHGRERILDHDDLVRDGERVRVPLQMMDGVQRAVFDSTRARGTSDTQTRVVDAREEAYRLRVLDDTNAYRRPDGAYPLSAGEGSYCTTDDGGPGHLVPVESGPWLVCKSDAAADASPAKRRNDAIPSRDAVEAASRG
jgi:hypothetical protein